MNRLLKPGFLIIFLASLFCVSAQDKQGNICYVNNDRMYLQLDDRWSDARKKEVSEIYNIDSLLIVQAFNGKIVTTDSLVWSLNRIDDHIVELSKALSEKHQGEFDPGDVVLLDDRFFIPQIITDSLLPDLPQFILQQIFRPWFTEQKQYGVNEFRKKETVRQSGDSVIIVLPGYQEAEQVYLSGSFNNWSTGQQPMERTSAGWQASLKLTPGKYYYKFIIDGRWAHDNNNRQKENDGQGGFNSVFYCYNHVFRLEGYGSARKVTVSGGFNNWQPEQLKMKLDKDVWVLPIYLKEGTYAYKFVVDGQWITDPANSVYRSDGYGNLNSFMGIGDSVIFRLAGYDSAQQVILSGSFNNWSTNELVMNKVAGGWELPYVLGRGYYEYKFIVDGKWMPDPGNPSTAGSGDFTNSCLVVGANHTFILEGFTDAQKVIVTGTFNGWQTESYRMKKENGRWQFPLYLQPGKHLYKFIVDGTWLLDPANELWEPNLEGTGNSVLWVEP